jgi:hypothetical protein
MLLQILARKFYFSPLYKRAKNIILCLTPNFLNFEHKNKQNLLYSYFGKKSELEVTEKLQNL